MPSELDLQLNAIMDGLTAPGGPLEAAPVERGGISFTGFKAAPPSLPALFAHFCAQHGDAEFLVDGEVRLSFSQTYALASRVAQGLIARHGVQKGDRVGIAARNSAGWILLYMGTVMAGGCVTLLNGWWSGEELVGGIELAGCKLVLADPARAARLEGLAHGSKLVPFRHGDPEAGLAEVIAGSGDPAVLPGVAGSDLATILFTSGSTGASKGAFSDHCGVVHGAMNYAALTLMVFSLLAQRGEAPQGQPTVLVNVPLFHVTGEIPVFLHSIVIGRKLVLMDKWDAREAMRLIEAERVTYFIGVPLMSYEIATHPDLGNYDLSSCATFAAGGAARPVEHVSRIREALPHAFPIIGYALTETNCAGCANFNENYLAKPGSTGPEMRPIAEVSILDESGEALPQGKVGEVAIRSIANMLGYWNNPEATAAAIRADGYFLTGDLGYLDPDGYLFIVDRKKDIIIRGGENIACLEVEQAIYAHADVAECSVFGLPDERLGEICGAVYQVREGAALTPEELKSFLAQHIAAFKIPERLWQAHEALPRLGTEKIDKVSLRRRYAEEAEAA